MATLNEFKDKLFWYIIPLLVGFFSWIVITLIGIKTEVVATNKDSEHTKYVAEQTLKMAEGNNEILTTFDEENKGEHKSIIKQINILDNKVNKLYIKNFGYLPKEQITYNCTYMDSIYNNTSEKKIWWNETTAQK